jgi:hypothetical protein
MDCRLQRALIMKRMITFGALAGMMAATPAGANEDVASHGIDLALQLSQCGGLYYAVSDLGPEAGQSPDDVQFARDMGNGWALASIYVLAQVRAISQPGLQPDAPMPPDVWAKAWEEAKVYIDDQVASNRAYWRSRLRGSGNPQIREQSELCAALNPIQVELVREMRHKTLTAPSMAK